MPLSIHAANFLVVVVATGVISWLQLEALTSGTDHLPDVVCCALGFPAKVRL